MRFTQVLSVALFLAVPLMPSCYSDLKRRNDDLANSNHQLENELDQVKAERDEARARETTLQQKASVAEDAARVAREQAAARPAGATGTTGQATDAVAGRSNADAAALAKKLSSSIGNSKGSVEVRDGKVCVTLALGDAFNPGSAELTAQGKKAVRDVGAALAKSLPADARLWVAGHTDADPPKKSRDKFKDNRHLSFERAVAVVAELSSAGISQKRMVPAAFGEYAPVAAGSGKQEKSKNRRVEIWID